MSDQFKYEGEEYALAGLDGSGLYTPADFGMDAFSTCTACWRGYVLSFDCVNNELILDKMLVNAREPKEINGVTPVSGEENFFKYSYEKLGLKTKFTGTLLLAKDFIREMYVHMGFQRPIAFRTVLEITVENGDIIKVEDLSDEMERRRQVDPDQNASPKDPSDVERWIEKSFSLDYEKPDE